MAYFGVQYRSEQPAIVRDALADLDAACASADGPGRVDRARYVDDAGYQTIITIAYWGEPGRHERWFVAARAMWLSDQHAAPLPRGHGGGG